MATSLEVKLRTAAAANPALSAALGTNPFRWYGPQEIQGSVFPNITALRVSAPPQYSTTQRLITSRYRMQLTIWDTDLSRGFGVETALLAFLDNFNAYNTGDSSLLQPNQVVNRTVGGNAETSPTTYWIRMDVFIWNNETL